MNSDENVNTRVSHHVTVTETIEGGSGTPSPSDMPATQIENGELDEERAEAEAEEESRKLR